MNILKKSLMTAVFAANVIACTKSDNAPEPTNPGGTDPVTTKFYKEIAFNPLYADDSLCRDWVSVIDANTGVETVYSPDFGQDNKLKFDGQGNMIPENAIFLDNQSESSKIQANSNDVFLITSTNGDQIILKPFNDNAALIVWYGTSAGMKPSDVVKFGNAIGRNLHKTPMGHN